MKDEQIIPVMEEIMNDVMELQRVREMPLLMTEDERLELLDAIIVLHQIYRRNR